MGSVVADEHSATVQRVDRSPRTRSLPPGRSAHRDWSALPDVQKHVEQFSRRVLQDALAEALPCLLAGRAEVFDRRHCCCRRDCSGLSSARRVVGREVDGGVFCTMTWVAEVEQVLAGAEVDPALQRARITWASETTGACGGREEGWPGRFPQGLCRRLLAERGHWQVIALGSGWLPRSLRACYRVVLWSALARILQCRWRTRGATRWCRAAGLRLAPDLSRRAGLRGGELRQR